MIYPVSAQNVETQIGRQWPWFVEGIPPNEDRYYGVCPYCDNPVRLKALYKRKPNSPRPYGQHTGKPQPGFVFDATRLQYCPYVIATPNRSKDERRQYDSMAEELIRLAVDEFDRVILVLEDSYGFPISLKLAREMLRGWFGHQGYLYAGAHPRNVPWMVGYFGGSASLFGRKVGKNPDLGQAIVKAVPGAIIESTGQLLRDGPWFDVRMQTFGHRSDVQDNLLTETMQMRVQNFTNVKNAGEAPVLYQKTMRFEPERFEALINTAPERARRHEGLLEAARQIEEAYR